MSFKLNYYEVNRKINNICARGNEIESEKQEKDSFDEENVTCDKIEKFEVNNSSDNNSESDSDKDNESECENSSASCISSHQFLDKFEIRNLSNDIATWAIENKITNEAANSLLNILNKYHPNLPVDVRTIKKKQKSVSEIIQMGEGYYSYIGLKKI